MQRDADSLAAIVFYEELVILTVLVIFVSFDFMFSVYSFSRKAAKYIFGLTEAYVMSFLFQVLNLHHLSQYLILAFLLFP